MLRNDNTEDIKGLRNYLYRELDNLQTQLNMVQDETSMAIAEAAKTGGSGSSPAPSPGIKDAPKDGKQYARQDGNWAEIAEKLKGLKPVGSGKTVTFPLDGATAVVVQTTHSSQQYSAIIPVAWMSATAKSWAIALNNTYLGVSVSNVDGICTVSHGSYTLTCYTLGAVGGEGGGSGETITDDKVVMTDYDGNLREAFAYAGGALTEISTAVEDLGIIVSQKVTDADGDGKLYGRKDGAWVEIDGKTAPTIIVLTEDMVSVTKTATKGVAPYSTSYYYTDITVNTMTESDLHEGLLIMPIVATTMVVASSYRNVRIRFGTSGAWHPVMGSTTILAGSSYFTATNYRLYQYRTNTRSEGAFHLMTDSNSTYSLMTDAEIAAGTATTGRTISAALWKTKQDAISDLDAIRAGAAAGATAMQELPDHYHSDTDIAMTDFDGNLQQAFAFAGQQMNILFEALPSDDHINSLIDAKLGVIENGAY